MVRKLHSSEECQELETRATQSKHGRSTDEALHFETNHAFRKGKGVPNDLSSSHFLPDQPGPAWRRVLATLLDPDIL